MINKYWTCFFALILGFNATQSIVFGQSHVTGRLSEIDSGMPIEGATVIENSNSSATITDSLGHFELDISSYPVKLSFSHLGYELKVIQLTEQPIGKIAIQLMPKKISIEEVVIKADKIIEFFSDDVFYVTDYEFWGNNIFVLGHPDNINKMKELRVCNLDGVAQACKRVDRKSHLFKDAFGNVHVVGDSLIEQVHYKNDSFSFLYSVNRKDNEADLKSIAYMQDSYSILRSNDGKPMIDTYFLYDLRDSSRTPIHYAYNHTLFNSPKQAVRYKPGSIPDVRFKPIKKSYEAEFDPIDAFTKHAQDRLLTYTPIESEVFVWNDTLIFMENDGPRCTRYTLDADVIDSVEIWTGNKSNNHSFIQDELTGTLYMSFTLKGKQYISRFNPETLSIEKSMILQGLPFIEKVKIHKNRIYFIHQEKTQAMTMSLFSTQFVENSQVLEKH